jgi:hypothetical protein
MGMHEGLPIAYEMLQDGVPVYSSEGEQVGRVASVLSAPEKDIFHGLLVKTDGGIRFAEAAAIASLHEFGVDLRLDTAAARRLPPPEHAAPVFDEDPATQDRWHHWVRKLTLRGDWKHEADR